MDIQIVWLEALQERGLYLTSQDLAEVWQDRCWYNFCGGRTTPAMVRTILRAVAPDYVQIDCKGHPGISSYPTKAGYAAPGIVRDQLAVWRKETRAAGLPLVMHYSGVQDGVALALRPDWAAVGKDGKPDKMATSVFGPYVDELLIPQLIELAVDHKVDGAWVDGEVWGVLWDWSRRTTSIFWPRPRRASRPGRRSTTRRLRTDASMLRPDHKRPTSSARKPRATGGWGMAATSRRFPASSGRSPCR